MRLDSSNVASLVAGSHSAKAHTDGDGLAARFQSLNALASDGKGSLYVLDSGHCIRKVSLVVNEAGAVLATVQTLTDYADKQWTSLAFHPVCDVLVASTASEVCFLPDRAASAAAAFGPVNLAGNAGHSPTIVDGQGAAARFCCITSIVVSPLGNLYLWDDGVLRRVDTWGNVSRVATTAVGGSTNLSSFARLASFPGGHLGVWSGKSSNLVLLRGEDFAARKTEARLRLAGDTATPAGAAAAEGATLDPASDLPSLLQQPTVGPATAIIRVGGTAFVGHRALLSARSEYFKQLLESDFAESTAAEVELADADPSDFAALLGSMYTGVLRVPEQRLRSCAELAGRLLLPAATFQLQGRILEASSPASVIGDLAWAQRHSFLQLVAGLKERVLLHSRLVAGLSSPAAVKQLASECPDLMAELFLTAVLQQP